MNFSKETRKINLFFLLATANFLAAFGGGAVLNRALTEGIDKRAFAFPHIEDPGLFAFLLGSVLGVLILILLKLTKSKWSWLSYKLGGFLSFGGAFISLTLIYLYHTHSVHGGEFDPDLVIFYLLMSLLFGFVFVPRSLRADAVAGDGQKIGWVEFSYAAGMVSGLVAQTGLLSLRVVSREQAIPFSKILAFNCGFQILAGLLDLYSSRLAIDNIRGKDSPTKTKRELELNWPLYIKVSLAAVMLTIGIQMVAFKFRRELGGLDVVTLAGFYFGAAVAGLLYSMIKTKLILPQSASDASNLGGLSFRLFGRTRRVSFVMISILAGLPLLAAIAGNIYRLNVCGPSPASAGCGDSSSSILLRGVFILFVAASAFLLEWLLLLLFNIIGLEVRDKNREDDRLVAVTFGFMAVAGALSLPVLGFWDGLPAHYSWVVTLVASLLIANVAVRLTCKRKVAAQSQSPDAVRT